MVQIKKNTKLTINNFTELGVFVNRKLIYLFLPLIRNDLLRERVLFGARYLDFIMRNKIFCASFVSSYAVFNFFTLKRLVRNSLLFIYNLIQKAPRSCIILVNGIKDNLGEAKVSFERTETRFNCRHLLVWYPGFLSNFKYVRFAYSHQYMVLLRKKQLSARQVQDLDALKSDFQLVFRRRLWRFPTLVVFFNTSHIFESAADEAVKLKIPSVGLIDIDTISWMRLSYFIPWSGKYLQSIKIYLQLISETLLRGFFSNLFHQRLGENIFVYKPIDNFPIRSEQEKALLNKNGFNKLSQQSNKEYKSRNIFKQFKSIIFKFQLENTERQQFQTRRMQRSLRNKRFLLMSIARYFINYNRSFVKNAVLNFFVNGQLTQLYRLRILNLFLLRRFMFSYKLR